MPVGVPDGSSSAPQYTFSSDTNTGLYKYTSDNLGITTGGAACAVFNSNGLSLWNGKKLALYDSGSSHYVGHKAPALTGNVNFTWPSDTGSNGQVLATNGSGVLSWQASVNDPPVGSIVMWPSSSVPSGWLHCNGQSVSRSTYSDLFAVISDDYGSADGNSFNVPDMRGLFVRGWANGESDDPDRASRTNRGDGTTGDNVGTKQDDEYKSHTHKGKNQTADANNANGHSVWVNDRQNGNYGSGSGSGGGPLGDRNFLTDSGGNETRPKNIAMMYIIRAT